MPDKTFILCPGASKSGTTWIRTYLGNAPRTDMGPLGEMQVWDAATEPGKAHFLMPTPPAWRRAEFTVHRLLGLRPRGKVLRWWLQQDPSRYVPWFAGRLARPNTRLSGDVTPGYAALSTETLRRIDDGFASRGITVKTIFTMRDPIERAWSLLKMYRRKSKLDDSLPDAEAFLRIFAPGGTGTTDPDYHVTLARLDEVFPPHRQFVTLYESLFTPATITALSAFAGIPDRPEAGGAPVNAAGDRSALPEGLAEQVFPSFAKDYETVIARLPEAAELWPHAHLLATR
ncbi:sulfotransferase family protein [Salipiger thiooxidans]|uniref:sulfotransferase family protein n=1 Tax=Salipiger thiooxidans TaxID=282683 RepID=UPI001CD47037|nr:sulfotransferase family protein [Salipiger thiooxidans]MCA0847769.1 sulfotransferase family protein [Salipiger thiooxidans]